MKIVFWNLKWSFPLLQVPLVNQVFVVDFLQENLLETIAVSFHLNKILHEADVDGKGDVFSIKVDWKTRNYLIFVQ